MKDICFYYFFPRNYGPLKFAYSCSVSISMTLTLLFRPEHHANNFEDEVSSIKIEFIRLLSKNQDFINRCSIGFYVFK